ncbi:MAG: mannose-6-phosphate isomerase, class I [Spirochaetales bacterium]|nr:MAG: mannose-6-phosphate isomerase, class I [Spirochaetales bacterium]
MSIFRLENTIQHYAWGNREGFISGLLGVPAEKGKPEAELWMGAHPLHPSRVLTEEGPVSLYEEVRKRPEEILGKRAAGLFFGAFPFLFKVLSAGKPLSIQAHPDKKQAENGFDDEERRGIPRTAENRNYRDRNHKPEIICALTPLTALKGFRTPERMSEIAGTLHLDYPDRLPASGSLKDFFTALMTMKKKAQGILSRAVLDKAHLLPPAEARVLRLLAAHYDDDVGVLAPLFLNVVELKPGEALYVPAGELHAYVEGSGMELMANSDNVLRGGLTPKHEDVQELLKVLDFSPGRAIALAPGKPAAGVTEYACEADEIMMTIIALSAGGQWTAPAERSAEILICLEGEGRLGNGTTFLAVKRGESAIIYASSPPYTVSGNMVLYRASVNPSVFGGV